MPPDFVSRSEARTRGLKHYFVGKKCKHGHASIRFVSTSACVACDKKLPPDPPEAEQRRLINDFKWNDDIRAVLIDEYINSGDLHGARAVVHLSAAAYYRELETNEQFAADMKKATVLAIQTFEDKSIHSAGKGNDKLILAVLKAKLPAEYSERKIVEHKGHGQLSDAEIDRRIEKLGRVIEHRPRLEDIPPLPANARRIDVARREARIAAIIGGEEAESGSKPN